MVCGVVKWMSLICIISAQLTYDQLIHFNILTIFNSTLSKTCSIKEKMF